MREYSVTYDINGRTYCEIFAVWSISTLTAEIDIIKKTGGYIIAIDCL
jgi:hypothetical protein